MTDSPQTTSPAPEPHPGLLARVVGVLVSPRRTYAAIVARPRSLGVILLVILVMAVSQGLFLASEVGQDALLDRQVSAIEAFGINISDQMYTQMEAGLARAPYTSAASIAVFIPLGLAVTAGLIVGVFSMLLGGTATFKQAYAIAAHSAVISALQQLFSMPLSYARGEFAGANLGAFVPMLEATSFPVRFLETIDLFTLWACVSLAIGIGVLYKRRTGGIAASFIGLYVVIALVIAFFRSGS